MFRYYILLVSIFLIKVPAFAQNNQEFNKVKDLSFQFEELNRSLKNNNQDSVIFISKNIKSILNLGSEEEHARIIPLNEILIDSYRFKNQFDSASIIASENIELLKSNNDTLSINYTSNLVNLGSFQLELNKYKEAKATYNRAENLFKYRNDTTSTYYIEFLAGKGLTENYYSNFSEAKYYLLKADLLIEKYIKRDEKSPNLFYVANLTNLAIANDGIADFEEGLKIKLKEKKYLESFNITNTYGYYLNQYNISVSYIKLGRNFDSEKILLEGLKSINDLNLGSYLKSKFSEGLSLVYFNLGDSTKSEYYNKLAFSSDGYNKSNVNDYSIYIQKASQLQSKGDFLGAYKIFKFIIDEILKLGLPRGKEYLMAIRIAYELSGLLENPPLSFKQRVDLLLELNVLTPKLFGYVSNENADVNASFGSAYYYDLMDYSKSVKSYKLAIDILEAIPEQSRNRLALINYNRNISNSYEKLGDYQLAYSSLIKANLLRYKIINEQIPFISEIERDRFVLDNQEENSRIKSFIWRNYQNLNPNTYIADLLIIDEFFGGLSFNYSIKIRKLLESFSDDIKSKYVDLLDNDLTEFSTNFNNPIEASSVENNDKRDLIKLITKQISEFKIQNTYLKIIDKKNFEGALVLFQSFKYDLLANTNLYSCVILSKDRTIIKYLPLFQESSLDSNLTNSNKTGSDLIKSINDIYSQKNKSQFRKYISEIIKLTKEFQNLVIIPSGKLNFINFGAFELEDGSSFGENHEINYFNSLSEFILNESKDSDIKFDAVNIFAGLDYNFSSLKPDLEKQKNNINNIKLKQFNNFSTSLRSFTNTWGYLPGTKTEGKSIFNILNVSTNNKIKVEVLDNGNGSENNFRKLVTNGDKSKILHLATHGFFFDKLDFKKMAGSRNANSVFDNSLFRSGLILSGGNIGWKSFDINKRNDDGILTSYEISKLSFQNVKLVVLSACDTGLGEVQSDEGIFGLQRSFKIAGADKIIMSLWKVPDIQTNELMSYFYQNLVQGQSVNKSLISAQSKMKLRYPPFYWAAFKLLN